PGLEPGHPPTRPPPDLRGADMFPQPAERHHTVKVRVPLTGGKGADVVEMLDGLLRFPQELRVTYEFAERWVDGKHQTAARETWTIVARTHRPQTVDARRPHPPPARPGRRGRAHPGRLQGRRRPGLDPGLGARPDPALPPEPLAAPTLYRPGPAPTA